MSDACAGSSCLTGSATGGRMEVRMREVCCHCSQAHLPLGRLRRRRRQVGTRGHAVLQRLHGLLVVAGHRAVERPAGRARRLKAARRLRWLGRLRLSGWLRFEAARAGSWSRRGCVRRAGRTSRRLGRPKIRCAQGRRRVRQWSCWTPAGRCRFVLRWRTDDASLYRAGNVAIQVSTGGGFACVDLLDESLSCLIVEALEGARPELPEVCAILSSGDGVNA